MARFSFALIVAAVLALLCASASAQKITVNIPKHGGPAASLLAHDTDADMTVFCKSFKQTCKAVAASYKLKVRRLRATRLIAAAFRQHLLEGSRSRLRYARATLTLQTPGAFHTDVNCIGSAFKLNRNLSREVAKKLKARRQ